MKTYPLPKLLDKVHDSASERSEIIGALYGTDPEGKKFVVPELWLQGDWLAKAGFTTGDHVAIQIEQGKLTIYKLEI